MNLLIIVISSLTISLNLQFQALEGQGTELYWIHDIEKAAELSEIEDKPILMVFSGSDWCKPCIQLREKIFKSEAFKAFAAVNLILVELDFPARKKNQLSQEQVKHNERLADKYNPQGVFPMVVLLLGSKTQYIPASAKSTNPQQYVQLLKNTLDYEK